MLTLGMPIAIEVKEGNQYVAIAERIEENEMYVLFESGERIPFEVMNENIGVEEKQKKMIDEAYRTIPGLFDAFMDLKTEIGYPPDYEECCETTFGLFVNNAAGEYYIQQIREDDCRQDGYFTCYCEFSTEEEAKNYITERKEETTVYAVFYDYPAGEGFISQEHDYSGNWKGSKYGYSNYQNDFKTEQEARKYLDKINERVWNK